MAVKFEEVIVVIFIQVIEFLLGGMAFKLVFAVICSQLYEAYMKIFHFINKDNLFHLGSPTHHYIHLHHYHKMNLVNHNDKHLIHI